MIEIWKDIIGYEGIYQVSNLGKVKSLDRIVKDYNKNRYQHIKGVLLKPTDNGYGYLVVSLRKNNMRKQYYVHRLVAEAFICNPENKSEVNHKNLNKYDNCENNLEWVTSSENKVHFLQTPECKTKTIKAHKTRFKNLTQHKIDEIIYRYTEKFESIENISKIVKLSKQTVKKVLLQQGIYIRQSNKFELFINFKIQMLDFNNNVVHEFYSYLEIFNFIHLTRPKTTNSTIRHSVKAVLDTNYKAYGYKWKKAMLNNRE